MLPTRAAPPIIDSVTPRFRWERNESDRAGRADEAVRVAALNGNGTNTVS